VTDVSAVNSALTFNPEIGWEPILTFSMILVGAFGSWITLKTQFGESMKRHVDLESKVTALDATIQAHKLHSADTFVRRDDLEKMEERLSKLFGSAIESFGQRMLQVEHTVRNLDTKILTIVSLTNKRGASDD
jgi:hypothetical protein